MLYEKIQLEAGEVVLTTVRKHWFIITLELLGVLAMALVPLVMMGGLSQLPALPLFASGGGALTTFGTAAWLLIVVMMAFMVWTNYYLDLWVITDRRIIVIDQRGFFNRKVSSFRLERLQDIKVTIKGIVATLLNYGTIRAQTAGASESNFASTGMPDPRGVQATIQGAMDERLKVLGGIGATL
jgi:uncharacterized membrane protein YdbT with pleckstrin-like domain